MFIHLLYFAALIEAYRTGDLGQVYPIARGSAPLMTATATTFFVGEKLSLIGWGGIVALVAGVFLLSAHGGRDLLKIDRRAVGFALLTALTICTYSVVDGIGARLSGNPAAYTMMHVRRQSRWCWCLMRSTATAAMSSRRCRLTGGAASQAAPCRSCPMARCCGR